MRRSKWFGITVGAVLALSLSAFGQEQKPSRGQSKASASAAGNAESSSQADASAGKPSSQGGRSADVRAGQKIDAQLVSALDARTAKPGDEVVARVTKNVKQDGRVVVHKGDRLVGHVTEVQSAATSKGESRLGVVFDQLATGESTATLNAVLVSMASAEQSSSSQAEAMAMPEPMPVIVPSGGARSSGGATASGGGGLIGGVGSTVGSVTGTAGTAVAGTTGATLGQVGGTVGTATGANAAGRSGAGPATPLRAIQINSEASGQHESSATSVLSTRHGDMRLESGTQMQFRVASQAEAK